MYLPFTSILPCSPSLNSLRVGQLLCFLQQGLLFPFSKETGLAQQGLDCLYLLIRFGKPVLTDQGRHPGPLLHRPVIIVHVKYEQGTCNSSKHQYPAERGQQWFPVFSALPRLPVRLRAAPAHRRLPATILREYHPVPYQTQ